MLYIPTHGCDRTEDNQGSTAAEYGTSVAAGAVQYTKNANYTALIASTTYDTWGLFVEVHSTAVASTRSSYLADIAIGAAGSEVVIIPNLIAGNQGVSGGAAGGGSTYFFPLRIAKGTRISATGEGFVAADVCFIRVTCLQSPIPGMWYGSRVTAYGVNTLTASGTSMSPGNNAYAAVVSVSAATTYPIKYMQVGTDLLTNATGSSLRGLIKISIGNDAPILVSDLPYDESTTLESTRFTQANMILMRMLWNIPAGINLNISAMRNAAAASRGWAIYGVD